MTEVAMNRPEKTSHYYQNYMAASSYDDLPKRPEDFPPCAICGRPISEHAPLPSTPSHTVTASSKAPLDN